jgi:uncharacterized damage-inducible protein DinB
MLPEAKRLIEELEQEAQSTRRVLERVPADKLTWKPHPKSMTLGQLARHVARLPGDLARVASADGFDTGTQGFRQAQPESAAELLPALQAALEQARAFLGGLDEARAAAPWRMMSGDREIWSLPRMDFIRNVMFNHLYHHRGQLTVYLRLLDIPVPATYGDSADESPLAGEEQRAATA